MAVRETSAACIGPGALVALALLWAPAGVAGEFHRWVDESGEIHYTDAPPPESVQSAGPRAGEQKESAAARGHERAAAAERAERSRRDEVLWRSYSTVADIERTRDRRLEAVDGEIALAAHRVEQARQQAKRYDRLLADLPADNAHRTEVEQGRAEARERLKRRRQELESVRAKRERMEARFARDIARFRELVADRQ